MPSQLKQMSIVDSLKDSVVPANQDTFDTRLKRREAILADQQAGKMSRPQPSMASTLTLGWGAGSSWNPATTTGETYRTSYQTQNSGQKIGGTKGLVGRSRRLGRNRQVLKSSIVLG